MMISCTSSFKLQIILHLRSSRLYLIYSSPKDQQPGQNSWISALSELILLKSTQFGRHCTLPRYNYMGQSQFDSSLSKNTQLIAKLDLIMYEPTPFGELPIYRLTQKPYDYFLRYRHTYPATAHEALAQAHDLYLSLSSQRNIVRIDVLQTQTTQDLCSKVLVLDAYARYHNYTLDHAILCKQQNRKMFNDADLLYIFISLVEVAMTMTEVLGRNNVGVFRTNRIFLSTEGYIKVYPYQLNAQNLMTHQSLDETCNGSEMEVQSNSKEPVRSEPYRSKTDLKDIAIVMAQLCLLQPDQHDQLSKQSTRYRLLNGLSGRISAALRNLLLHLLEGGQMPWPYLKEQLQLIKNEERVRPAYCIRLQDNISLRESEIMVRQKQEDMQKERHKMLQALQMNLVPSRIQIISKNRNSNKTN